MARILLTGHKGYLGARVLDELLRRGDEVLAIDSGLFSNSGHPAASTGQLSEISSDIRDMEDKHLEGAEAVIHAAGVSSHAVASAFPESTREINTTAAIRLGEMAKRAGARRFVFLSSASLYEAASDGWSDEDTPPNIRSVYSETKLDAERAICAMASHRFAPLSLRLPTAFGDSENLRLDLIINKLIARVSQGRQLQIHGSGGQYRPFAHVADIARIIVKALDFPVENGDAYLLNACIEEMNFSIRDIFGKIEERFPDIKIVRTPETDLSINSYRVRSKYGESWIGKDDFRHSPENGIDELNDRFSRNPLSTLDEDKGDRRKWIGLQMEKGRLDTNLRLFAR